MATAASERRIITPATYAGGSPGGAAEGTRTSLSRGVRQLMRDRDQFAWLRARSAYERAQDVLPSTLIPA